MKAAFTYWENRIAPVFDVARQIHIVEAESGQIVAESEEVLANDLPVQKAIRLADLGVAMLVCGAISRPLQAMVSAYGIMVVPFIAGDLCDVVQAWLRGKLERDAFAMPGCYGRGKRLRRRTCGMNRANRPGQGRERDGHEEPPGEKGQSRRGGARCSAAGTCLCPTCGCREPHAVGAPCVEKQCPKCGTAMTREFRRKKGD